jgi:predicted AAA+ superfamily ATPase
MKYDNIAFGWQMTYINRQLNLKELIEKGTVFLFGPRQTGKSTYIRHEILPISTKAYSLLDHGLLLRFKADPTRLRQEVEAEDWRDCLIVIDEVQKCPELLDEVHYLIEERGIRFLLTGSSARALKRSGVNLLGGRGRDRAFHPFIHRELKKSGFNLLRAMQNGLIPNHYFADDADDLLQSYVSRYLAEEIIAEGVSRNIPAFARFLEVAAACNSQQLDYTAVASDTGVSRQTVQNYFQILKDTLLGYELSAWTGSVKRKAMTTPKFYFFDMGVVKSLRRLESISEASQDFGDFFEHFLFLEMRAWIDYTKPSRTLHYWRSTSAFEVDFILDGKIAIEVKSTTKLSRKHFKGLKALQEENIFDKYILVCREKEKRITDGILVYPWELFLSDLWDGKIIPSMQNV